MPDPDFEVNVGDAARVDRLIQAGTYYEGAPPSAGGDGDGRPPGTRILQILVGLGSVVAGAAAEGFDRPALWWLVVLGALADAALALGDVWQLRRAGSARPVEWLVPGLVGAIASGLLTWAVFGLLPTPQNCPPTAPDEAGTLDRYLQPVELPNALTADLVFCPVDVNEGSPVDLEYSFDSYILGELPDDRQLVLIMRPDPETCDTFGSRGTGGFYLLNPERFRYDERTGRWQFNARISYPEATTITFRYYLALASEDAIDVFRADARAFEGEGYPGMRAVPEGVERLAYIDLRRALPNPLPSCRPVR